MSRLLSLVFGERGQLVAGYIPGRTMQLQDGLTKFQSYPSYYSHTLPLESEAKRILNLLAQQGNAPTPSALSEVKKFLIDVEKWKADCLKERMVNAAQNSETCIWEAFLGAVQATTDVATLLSIMQLKGFGASMDDETGQRRAKVATSVLRFFWPERWGVVDWRVAAMLGLLNKHQWNVDTAFAEAKNQKANDLRKLYDLMNEEVACKMNQEYRAISQKYPGVLPRAADVDMALFGLSLLAWPLPG